MLTAAVSGTVGLGNIAGVAVAVSIGGPGATFWMILCGLLGMATKFVEVTLGVKYREVHADGTARAVRCTTCPRDWPNASARNGKTPSARSSPSSRRSWSCSSACSAATSFQVNQSHAQLVSVTGGENGLMGSSACVLFSSAS